MTFDAKLQLRLSDGQKNFLEKMARDRQVSESGVVRQILRSARESIETGADPRHVFEGGTINGES